MNVGFNNANGELVFVFSADELREAQKIIEMFGWQGNEEVDRILEQVELWATTMEKRQ